MSASLDLLTLAWLNSREAPSWVELTSSTGYDVLQAVAGGGQWENWATSWSQEILEEAAAALPAGTPDLQLRSATAKGGGTSGVHLNEDVAESRHAAVDGGPVGTLWTTQRGGAGGHLELRHVRVWSALAHL